MTDNDLYQEENLAVQKEIRDRLSNSMTVPIMQFQMPDTMKANIVNEVTAKIVDTVPIDDTAIKQMNSEVVESLELVAKTITKAVQESVQEPVTSITVNNSSDFKQDSVSVTNLSIIEKALDKVVKTIIENQPVVHVEKQTVQFPRTAKEAIPVRLSDGKGFYNAVFQAVAAASGESDPLAGYQITDLDDSGTTKYYGYCKPNGQWYIMENNTTAGTYRYSRGYRLENSGALYIDAWTDRANLTYSYVYEVF